MTAFELEKEIKGKFYRAFASGIITVEELESLPVRLGCLALNLFDAEQDAIADLHLAKVWLMYRRQEPPYWQKNQQPTPLRPDISVIQLTDQELTQAERLLGLAIELNFLVQETTGLRFQDETRQDYFCAIYCKSYPIDSDILNRTVPRTWDVWSDLDLDLPEKVWQFIKDGNEDEEYNASSLLMMIGEFTFRRDKSLWWELVKEETATILLEDLKDPNDFVRGRAASILSGSRNPRFVEPFLDALFDTTAKIRASIAIGLGTLEEKRAVPGLIKLLDDEDGFVRERAVFALSYIKDPAAVEPLIETLLYDEDAGAKAALVIGHFKDSRTVEPLIKVLEEDWVELKEYAAQSLGKIGDKRAIEPLAKLLNDEEENVVAAAASALLKLGDSRGFQFLTGFVLKAANSPGDYLRQSWRVVDVLGESGDERAVKPLLDALPPSSGNLKHTIIVALGNLGNPVAIEPLIKLLTRKEDPLTRARAAEALGKFGAEAALPKLEELAKHDQSDYKFGVKDAVLEAIEQIKEAVAQREKFPDLFPEPGKIK